jgi:Na+/serine symporter
MSPETGEIVATIIFVVFVVSTVYVWWDCRRNNWYQPKDDS